MPAARPDPADQPAPIRLLLADDQPLLRTGFRTVLGAHADLDIVGEASHGSQAVALTRQLLPDVVLIDAHMPGLHAIANSGPPVRVLALTSSDTTTGLDTDALDAIHAGASGFLAKDAPAADLATAIRAVAAGQAVMTHAILRHLLDHHTPPGHHPPAHLHALTDREREVLAHVARGLSNAEISHALRVSETTIKTHIGRMLTKLHLRDRVQAVVLAYECGLVRPGG